MDYSAAGRFPEVGIIVSYTLVALFGFTGAWFVRQSRWLAAALLGIALIFTACVTSYFLTAIHAPAKWIQIEHYFVALFGTVAAIALFPLFSIRFSREVEDLRAYRKISTSNSALRLTSLSQMTARYEAMSKVIEEKDATIAKLKAENRDILDSQLDLWISEINDE